METVRGSRDFYATVGTAAWRNWYERCSVSACEAEQRDMLAKMIVACVRSALRREAYRDCDIRVSDIQEEDIVQDFDVYMQAGGNLKKHKAYKQYLGARYDTGDDNRLKEMVCKTIFGHERGMVRDIARMVIVNHYGWQRVKIEGARTWVKPQRLEIDSDGKPLEPQGPSIGPDDVEDWEGHVRGVLCAIGGKTDLEAPLLAYVICEEISPSNKALQKNLGVAQVMTYRKVNTATKAVLGYMKRNGLTSADVGLVSALRAESVRRLGKKILEELEK